MQEHQIIIFGKHAAIAALNNNKRKIHQIFINENRKHEYKKLINPKLFCKAEYVTQKKIEKLCGQNSLHQGVAVVADRLPNYQIRDLLSDKTKSLVIILDQISDPYNFGNIIRSAKAFGVDFIIAQNKYSPKENSTIAKIASGALEDIPICNINNLSSAIEILKKYDYFCYGLDCHTKQNINKVKFTEKSVIIIGSEGEGIRNSLLKKCDFLIQIPMNASDNFDSINVSNAAAIAMYSYFLQ